MAARIHSEDLPVANCTQRVPFVGKGNDGKLMLDFFSVISARHDEYNVWIGGDDGVPGYGNTRMPGFSQCIDTASHCDHLGDPVSADEWRFEPLKAKYTRSIGQVGFQLCNSPLEVGGELTCFFRVTAGIADGLNIGPNVVDSGGG